MAGQPEVAATDVATPEGEGSAVAPPPHSIRSGLETVRQRFGWAADPGATADEQPVFVLAAGWRSGSTLLQRLLTSSRSLLIWGEPYDNSASIRRLAEMFVPFDETWPPDNFILTNPADMGSDRWIANRYPHPKEFVSAHRAFLDRLFAEPARRAGFDRWGVKTVRLTGDHALYLKALYPDARIIFLVRNPYDAFLSYRLLHDIRPHSYWWYYRWPDKQATNAQEFGLVWRELVGSFCEVAHEVGALMVSYEALIAGEASDELARFVGADLQGSALTARVGSSTERLTAHSDARATLGVEELWELRDAVDPLARELGYTRVAKRAP